MENWVTKLLLAQQSAVLRIGVKFLYVGKGIPLINIHSHINWKLGREKFCQDFSKGQTNFVRPVRPDPNPSIHGVINQCIKKIKLVFKISFSRFSE